MCTIDVVGKEIKRLRVAAGLSQRELAETTHLSRATINDYEVGNLDNISKDTLLKLTLGADAGAGVSAGVGTGGSSAMSTPKCSANGCKPPLNP